MTRENQMQALDPFLIGNLSLEPGQRLQGRLATFYLPDGTEVGIPLMAVRGKKDGPVLWLGAAMHGQELSGIPVIWEIIKKLVDPESLCGTVVGAPLLNPFSFNGRTYYSPEEGYNLNRVFPGDPQGMLVHRLADSILEAIQKCDYAIDYHCNMASALCFSIIDEPLDETVYDRYKKMAQAFGITIIEAVRQLEAHRTGLISDEAEALGIPVLTVELVPWRAIDPQAVEVGVRGTLNVMRSIGMLAGEIEPQQGIQIIPGELSRLELNATRGGLVQEYANVGDEIKNGQLIGQIVDPFGDPVEDIVSPIDGWLLAWPMIHNQAAGTGEHVAFIAFRKGNGS